jgi:hypothetical protein
VTPFGSLLKAIPHLFPIRHEMLHMDQVFGALLRVAAIVAGESMRVKLRV